MTRSLYIAALASVTLGGCGSSPTPGPTAPPATPTAERSSVQNGRITLRGDVGPAQFGPVTLEGRYRASFRQRGKDVDFATEVPFTAHLELPDGSGAPKERKLFQRAARTGATTITATGRWHVLVDFGDSPFEIVLSPTPAG